MILKLLAIIIITCSLYWLLQIKVLQEGTWEMCMQEASLEKVLQEGQSLHSSWNGVKKASLSWMNTICEQLCI